MTSIIEICLIIKMPLCLSPYLFVKSYKLAYLIECKQLRKHPEPITEAKRKSWFFSEIKISYFTELQAYVAKVIYHTNAK